MASSRSIPMIIKRFVSFVGSVRPSDLPEPWGSHVVDIAEDLGAQDARIALAEIKGSRPHMSHNDHADTKPVISIRFFDIIGKRLITVHAHEDGSHTTPQKKK